MLHKPPELIVLAQISNINQCKWYIEHRAESNFKEYLSEDGSQSTEKMAKVAPQM